LPQEDETQLTLSLENFPEALEYMTDRAILHQMLAKSVSYNSLPVDLQINPAAISSSSSNTPVEGGGWLSHPWMWAASAIAVCLLLISIVPIPNLVASPVDLVQKTLIEYQSPTDRCYSVKVEMESRLRRNKFPRRTHPSDSLLWVRGSSFVQIFESPGDQLVWGRNTAGSVWFTISGRSAAIFEESEIPQVLQDLCDLRSLEFTSLLESLLEHYDLEYIHREEKIHIISAHPRPEAGPSKYGTVEIEIDADSRLIRRVEMERLVDNRLIAVVCFTLQETQQRDEAQYDVTAHLVPNSRILDRQSRFGQRSDLLREFLQKLRSPSPVP
jgi:hypothetical protein